MRSETDSIPLPTPIISPKPQPTITWNALCWNGEGSGKVSRNPYPGPDHSWSVVAIGRPKYNM